MDGSIALFSCFLFLLLFCTTEERTNMFRTHNSCKTLLMLTALMLENQTSPVSSLFWKVWKDHSPLLEDPASNTTASGPRCPLDRALQVPRSKQLRCKLGGGPLSGWEKTLAPGGHHLWASTLDCLSHGLSPAFSGAAYPLSREHFAIRLTHTAPYCLHLFFSLPMFLFPPSLFPGLVWGLP